MPHNEDVLTHWTGRTGADVDAFAVLRSICAERLLRLSYCPTYVREDFQPRVSMVCFTDIPLKESAEHCQRFGRCGIAFKKDALIRYGANPVLYTTENYFNRIMSLSKLLDRLVDLEKDREWKEAAEPYLFTEDQTWALLQTLGLLQDYRYMGRSDAEALNYAQREWRLTFQSLPFAGGNAVQEPGMSCFYVREGRSYETVAFAADDVSFLIVPREFEGIAASIAEELRCAVKIYEDEVTEPRAASQPADDQESCA